MGLIVWLPLDNDKENKGISNYIATWSPNTFVDGGKIGKCANIIAHTDTKIPASLWDYPNKSISYGAWFKFNQADIQAKISSYTWDSNNRTAKSGLIGNINYGGFSLRLETNDIYADGSFSSVRVYSYLRSSANYANISYVSTKTTVPFDTWVHVFTVLDREEGRMKNYVNGVLTSSIVVDMTKITAETMQDKIGNFIIDQSSMDGGVARVTTLPMKINDIRIYDEALSNKEVKEISKCLVAHYKFDDPYSESTTNLVPANIYNYISVPGAYYSGIREITTFGGFKCFSVTTVASSSHCDGFICQQTGNCINGDTYTYSGYAWIPSGYTWIFGERQITGGGAYAQIALAGNSQWQYFSKTFTANDNTSGMIEGHEYEDYSTAHTIYIRDLQLEKKDHATPFAKGTRTSTIIPDVSGYRHDLTPKTGTSTLSTDTPRYTLSITNNQDYFYYDGFYTLGETTICVWTKPTAWTYTDDANWVFHLGSSGTMSEIQNGAWISASKFAIRGGNGANLSYTFNLNIWYHLAVVVKNNMVYGYVNGVLIGSCSGNSSITKSILTVANRSNGTPGTSSVYQYQGQLSDLRFYCTALTGEDIKGLYQTSALIDNKNNLLTYELKEEE